MVFLVGTGYNTESGTSFAIAIHRHYEHLLHFAIGIAISKSMSNRQKNPVLLVIRDGWGENHNKEHDAFNAIRLAKTPICDALSRNWPRTEIIAYGLDVGLPQEVMGNSEVGHQNIGAGRIVNQEIARIDKALESGELAQNSVLQKAFRRVQEKGTKLHFMGLISDAGVHSRLDHLYELMALARKAGVEQAFIHAFTDGRDTPPKSGLGYIQEIKKQCEAIGIGKIASVSGRYWAMDRDKRWDRVEKAYNSLIGISTEMKATDAEDLVKSYYEKPLDDSRQGDEFILPSYLSDEKGEPVGRIEAGDSVIFFNFRGDRPRELIRAFTDEVFDGFEREKKIDIDLATLSDYEKGLCPNVIFQRPPKMINILGSYVSDLGIAQFRCTETEKYPHVTFFFNDYREEPFAGEDRELIPSPKEVPTYDLKPEMSAHGICKATLEAILSQKYGLLVVNFANADMVGHTGSLKSAIKAAEVVDACIGKLLQALDQVKGIAVITADHGNSDQMWNPETNTPHTQHTLNPVEVVVYGEGCKSFKLKKEGRLADVAPTVLALMGLDQPEEMLGSSLIDSMLV